MRTILALLVVAAVSAHWTHDESLAREIGPPPGEEDVEVSNLGEADNAGEIKTYRITFGTTYTNGKLGASLSEFKVYLKGAKPAAPTGGKGTAWTEDTSWKTNDNSVIRYHQGAMSYTKAKAEAPALRPGMTPVVDKVEVGCSNLVKGKLQVCPAAKAKAMDKCEPMAKACKQAIKMAQVAYKEGHVTRLSNGINFETNQETQGPHMGPIQRGQFQMDDVGKITQVKIAELKAYTPSDPCFSKAAGFKKAACSSPWRPAFVKISTNSVMTGVGDGTYYITPCKPKDIRIGVYLQASGKTQVEKGPVDLVAKALTGKTCSTGQNAVLAKCQAETCEEEMDTKLGMMDKDRYEFETEI